MIGFKMETNQATQLEPTTPGPDFNPTLALAPANRCRMPPSVKGINTGVAPEEETITFSCVGQQNLKIQRSIVFHMNSLGFHWSILHW